VFDTAESEEVGPKEFHVLVQRRDTKSTRTKWKVVPWNWK